MKQKEKYRSKAKQKEKFGKQKKRKHLCNIFALKQNEKLEANQTKKKRDN
jgi:hypothetical protein